MFKKIRREDLRIVFALAFLLAVWIFCAIKAARADDPHSAPIPTATGWELVSQNFDATNGELIGRPLRIGYYKTAMQCSKAQQGRVSRPHNYGLRWVATVYSCRHKEPGGVV